MKPTLFISIVILCGITGITATVLNRFRKKAASFLALVAGFSPCLFFMAYEGVIESEFIGVAVGMYGAAPLFLASFFAFGFGKTTPAEKKAATTSLIGFFLGLIYSLLLIDILSRAE